MTSNVTLHEATIDLIEKFIDIETVSFITWPSLKKEANMVKEASDENGKSYNKYSSFHRLQWK